MLQTEYRRQTDRLQTDGRQHKGGRFIEGGHIGFRKFSLRLRVYVIHISAVLSSYNGLTLHLSSVYTDCSFSSYNMLEL